VLPEGLGFLKPGWWMLHVLAVGMVFVWGYREGRDAEREERKQEERARQAGKPPAAPGNAAEPAPPADRSPKA
jgi:hypothetical protein